MPNGTYGGVRGKETKVGQKTFVSRPTRFQSPPSHHISHHAHRNLLNYCSLCVSQVVHIYPADIVIY